MSASIRNIREISNDPLAKFANDLSKKLSRFTTKEQLEKLEDKEDIYLNGIDFDEAVKLHSLLSSKTFDFNDTYYSAFEPDGARLRLWLMGTNLGNELRDYSSLDRTVNILGDPLLIDGTPFDDGTHTTDFKSLALRFNRPTSAFQYDALGGEYLRVINGTLTTLGLSASTVGKSYFIRFRLKDLSTQDGDSRHLFEKTDDATPTDGIRVLVDSSGRVIVRILKGGVQYNKQTATSTIVADTVYDLWVTYAVSGNVVHIYVNNVDKSLTDPGSSTNWHNDLTDIDMFIFRRGLGSPSGYVYGDLYDYRIYDEKVVSGTEVGYHYTNKWTISNIAFGSVAVSNYFGTGYQIGSGFTTTGYTTTGYDT
jgi:hypothetical protein